MPLVSQALLLFLPEKISAIRSASVGFYSVLNKQIFVTLCDLLSSFEVAFFWVLGFVFFIEKVSDTVVLEIKRGSSL